MEEVITVAKDDDMNKQFEDLRKQFETTPPKYIGDYKRRGWAENIFKKMSNNSVEVEENGTTMSEAILQANDGTFYPAFISLTPLGDIGVYFIIEGTSKDEYNLVPYELIRNYLGKTDEQLLPFQYTLLTEVEDIE